MQSYLGLAAIVVLMGGLAIAARLVRKFSPAHYGRFWRVWGELPTIWLYAMFSLLVGQLLVELSNQVLTKKIPLGGQEFSLSTLLQVGMGLLAFGIGVWFIVCIVWRD